MKKILLSTLIAMGLMGQLKAQEPGDASRYLGAPIVPIDYGDQRTNSAQVSVGGDFLLLRPYFNSNPAFITRTTVPASVTVNGPNTTVINPQTNTNTTDFANSFGPAFRLWAGYQFESGLGVRGRWFHYDHSNTTGDSAISVGGPTTPITRTTVTSASGNLTAADDQIVSTVNGVTTNLPLPRPLIVTSRLLIDTWDAEITQSFQWCERWNVLVSAGARYGCVVQDYNAVLPGVVRMDTVNGVPTNRNFTEGTDHSRHTFTGGGPTIALEFTRRLGCSNLSIFGGARGSLLFGQSHLDGDFTRHTSNANLDAAGNVINSADAFSAGSSRTGGFGLLPSLELDLGMQWTRRVGNTEIFLRPSVVSQTYYNGGSSTSRNGDFGLFGFAIASGIRY